MSKQHKRKIKQPPIKERNVVAMNPLLRKSSVHEKTGKAKRIAAKMQLKKTWLERAAAQVAAWAAAGQSQVFTFHFPNGIADCLVTPFGCANSH